MTTSPSDHWEFIPFDFSLDWVFDPEQERLEFWRLLEDLQSFGVDDFPAS